MYMSRATFFSHVTTTIALMVAQLKNRVMPLAGNHRVAAVEQSDLQQPRKMSIDIS
jgi:hypothetical protein